MKFDFLMPFLFSLVVCFLEGGSVVAGPPEADASQAELLAKIEQEFLEYHQQNFQRGQVVLHKNTGKTEFEYRITFDLDQIRFDWRGRETGAEWGSYHKHVVNADHFLAAYPDGTVVTKAFNKVYADVREHYMIFHPRGLGTNLSETNGLVRTDLRELLGRPDRSPPKVTEDNLQGIRVWRIEFTIPSSPIQPVVTVWLAPEMGYNILKATSRAQRGERSIESNMSATYKQYSPNNIWYPSEVVHRSLRDGQLTEEVVVTVQEASFGSKIDGQVFTLAGMDIEPGRYVSDMTTNSPNHLAVWDGSELIPEKVSDQATGPVGSTLPDLQNPSASRKWILLLGAMALAMIACFFVVRLFRSRQKIDAE